MAGAPKGNKNGVKLKDPNIRQEAYQSYCDWIASGKAKDSWTFEHPQFTCCYKTIEKYIHSDHIEFPPIKKEIAEAKSFRAWEERGMKMLNGEMKAETALYQMFMRNKFGWDKEDVSQVADCAADKILDAIRKNIT